MLSHEELLTAFVVLWAVIDPIGTIPVFASVTSGMNITDKKKVASIAAIAASGILLFFIVAGEILLRAMGVPLTAFQISGGLILFLFALTMIFGTSKPDEEMQMIRSTADTAIFPLATPSIASPGAIMAAVLLTENSRNSIPEQIVIAGITLLVVFIAYILMRCSVHILNLIGDSGASIASRIMGLILASVAATYVLEGIKKYFQI